MYEPAIVWPDILWITPLRQILWANVNNMVEAFRNSSTIGGAPQVWACAYLNRPAGARQTP